MNTSQIPRDKKVNVYLEEGGFPDPCVWLREDAADIVFLTTREQGMAGWRVREVYVPTQMIKEVWDDGTVDLSHHRGRVRYQTLLTQEQAQRYKERARQAGLRIG